MKKRRYVFDSYALLAFFQGEAGGSQVRALLALAFKGEVSIHLSYINLGEVFYIVDRRFGGKKAREIVQDVQRFPMKLESPDLERVLEAAGIKAKFPVAYADAFAVALARELGAVLVTGDPEFKKLERHIEILWL